MVSGTFSVDVRSCLTERSAGLPCTRGYRIDPQSSDAASTDSGSPRARLRLLQQRPASEGSPNSDQPDGMSLDQVSERLSVTTATLLTWERHHGLALGQSTDGRPRRYSPDDLAVLTRVRDQAVTARASAAAAAMVHARLTATPTQLCTALLAATHRLDVATILEVLDCSAWLRGIPATIDDVVLPALREIGNLWSRGACDVAQENLATTTVQSWLHTQSQALPPPAAAPLVVLSCGPTEQHTLGLTALAVLLAHHGLAHLDLGARTPATSLRSTIHNAGASAVVLTAHISANRSATVTTLRKLGDTGADLYYAGAAFRTLPSRRGVPGTYLGGSLTNAATHLATRLKP
jgi:methanogenic corrinoid protein MtbC1